MAGWGAELVDPVLEWLSVELKTQYEGRKWPLRRSEVEEEEEEEEEEENRPGVPEAAGRKEHEEKDRCSVFFSLLVLITNTEKVQKKCIGGKKNSTTLVYIGERRGECYCSKV